MTEDTTFAGGRLRRRRRRAEAEAAAAEPVALRPANDAVVVALAPNPRNPEPAPITAPTVAPAAPAPAPAPGPASRKTPRPVARPARLKFRHKGLLVSFILMVLGPVGVSLWYLDTRAADQYASTLGFTVRSEDGAAAVDPLGGLGASLGATSTASDTDILYEFIRSQDLVATVDAQLDLRGHYSQHAARDPLFGLIPGGTIEDVTEYWERMVRVSYDAGSGLMEIEVLAFDPVMAQTIAEAIRAESTALINALAATAREDATRYAREDLELAVERLKQARESLTAFRIENQIVDLTADIQGQMGLLNMLQAQQAEALIELDLLRQSAREGDPRLTQAQDRIAVIEARIADERLKFGAGSAGVGGESYAMVVSEFERLTVDREFAEQAYLAALAAFDMARADANRQNLYLAAYIAPTLAEKSQYPQRPLMVAMVALFAFLIWVIATVVFYALRDRR